MLLQRMPGLPQCALVQFPGVTYNPLAFQSKSNCCRGKKYSTFWRPAARQHSTTCASGRDELQAQFELLTEAFCPGTLLSADFTALGRGLVASTNVQPGAVLLAVDWAHILCVTDEPKRTGNVFGKTVLGDWQMIHQKMPPLLVSYLLNGDVDWFLRLTAWMLFLHSRVNQGPLTIYKQLLPRPEEVCSLMHYTPAERPQLQSPPLDALAAKERGDILGVHRRVFCSQEGELRALKLAPTPEDTLWAAAMVNSRCFSEKVGGEVVSLVVPCADMANHQNTPNAVYAFNPARDAFELTALQGIAAREEVCISYGCQRKSNDELMRDYGMVFQANPNDRIPFQSDTDVASQLKQSGGGSPAPPLSLHATHLPAAVLSPDASRQLPQGALDRLPAVLASLKPFLRSPPPSKARLATPVGAAAPGAVAAAERGSAGSRGVQQAAAEQGGAALEGGELAQERQAVTQLRQQCRLMLEAHGTTVETDEALLRGEGAEGQSVAASPRWRQAVESRLERKRLLQAADQVLRFYENSLEQH